jgi:hypothetical protein
MHMQQAMQVVEPASGSAFGRLDPGGISSFSTRTRKLEGSKFSVRTRNFWSFLSPTSIVYLGWPASDPTGALGGATMTAGQGD